MLKFHPDNNGDSDKASESSSGYEVLKKTLKNIKEYQILESRASENYNIIIPLNQLIKLYDGEKIKINDKEFNIKDIQRYGALIVLEASLLHNGLETQYNNIQRWQLKDRYSINCDIYVENLNDTENVSIKLNGVSKEIEISSQSMLMNFTFPYNITVQVIVNKKIRANEQKR